MPRRKNPVLSTAMPSLKDDLLSLLSPERQREILEEVIGVHVRALFERHQHGTLGSLIDALKDHAHWDKIRHVSVASVMRPGAPSVHTVHTGANVHVGTNANAHVGANANAHVGATAHANDTANKVPVQHAAPAKKKKKAAAAKKPPRPKLDDATVESVFEFIKLNPNLRSEDIQKRVGTDPALIKAGIVKLRELKRVNTVGAKRATTYTAIV